MGVWSPLSQSNASYARASRISRYTFGFAATDADAIWSHTGPKGGGSGK